MKVSAPLSEKLLKGNDELMQNQEIKIENQNADTKIRNDNSKSKYKISNRETDYMQNLETENTDGYNDEKLAPISDKPQNTITLEQRMTNRKNDY